MKKLKINPVKTFGINPVKVHFNLDTDRDGVRDDKDCRPFNPRKQHIRPSKTMRQRLERIPLYVTDEPIKYEEKRVEMPSEYWKGIYPVTSKKAKKLAPHAQQQMYSVIKKYPSVVGQMEKVKPKIVLYSSRTFPEDVHERPHGWESEEKIVVRPCIPITKETKSQITKRLKQVEEQEDIIPTYKREFREKLTKEAVFPKEQTIGEIGQRQRRAVASAMHHELAHVKQKREIGIEEMHLQSKSMDYDIRPYEEMAKSEARYKMKQLEEKFQSPTGKEITKTLQLDEDDENEENKY